MDQRIGRQLLAMSRWTPSELFVTVEDTALLLGVTQDRLRALIKQGIFPYRGSPHDPMIPLSTLEYQGESVQSMKFGDTRLDRALARAAIVADDGPESADRPPTESTGPVAGSFVPNRIIHGNALDVAHDMPEGCVQSIVTSPPFWGQRVYDDETVVQWNDGSTIAFGREPSPEDYVRHTLEVLGALMRVMKPRGTIWWNIGDTYMTRTIMRSSSKDRIDHYGGKRTKWAGNPARRVSSGHSVLKDKDLSLIPFQIASGAQDLGLWVRSIIVWSKERAADDWQDHITTEDNGILREETVSRAHMPEIVADRPVTGHEYILLFAKQARYDYYPEGFGGADGSAPVNVRSVWTFPPVGGKSDHGARFPDELPRRCILLGSKKGDLIFDPFAGQGTTLRVANHLERQFIGCDISSTYVGVANVELQRLAQSKRARNPGEQPAQPRLLSG